MSSPDCPDFPSRRGQHSPARPLSASPLPPGTRWSILCHVIDNFGDAGVCWRLARQLAREHGALVTLCIDRPELVARLAGRPPPYRNVALSRWPEQDEPGGCMPDVVVSAFGAEPPPRLRRVLAGAPARPLWLNLEYLSAEPWIDGCHGLVSVKPDGAHEHFFYPGFTAASGGLLREHDAVAEESCRTPAARAALLRRLGLPALRIGERLFTLFCYPHAPLDGWLSALAEAAHATLLLVPQGVAGDAIGRVAGRAPAAGEPPACRGSLRLVTFPFVSQDDYDALLRAADFNVVRGEDSWVRAHWACRPFVWQPYRQEDDAHRVKLDAFLARLRAAALDPAHRPAGIASACDAIEALMRAWSGGPHAGIARAWRAFEAVGGPDSPAVRTAFDRWTRCLLAQPDLAMNLARRVACRLQAGKL